MRRCVLPECRTVGCLVALLLLTWGTAWTSTGREDATELVRSGEELFLRGECAEAQEILKKALEAAPGNARALSALGRAQYHLGRREEAEASLLHSLTAEAKPGDDACCWNKLYLGRIAEDRKDFLSANNWLQQAIAAGQSLQCGDEANEYAAHARLLLYAEKRLTESVATPRYVIHYGPDGPSAEDIGYLKDIAGKYYDKICDVFQAGPLPKPMQLYIYPNYFRCDLWEAKEILAKNDHGSVYIYFNRRTDMGALEHEMTHVLTARFFPPDHVSPLLSEGLAEYVGGAPWGTPLDKWVKGFRVGGAYAALEELAEAESFRRVNPVVSYTESASFIKFLIERRGVNALVDFIHRSLTWESGYGLTLAELERLWLSGIDRVAIDDREEKMFAYRLWLGDYFASGKMRRQGLPWVGAAYALDARGIVISGVAPGSPAESSGLRTGDVIKGVDGVGVSGDDVFTLLSMVQRKGVGDRMILSIEREGKDDCVPLVLGRERIDGVGRNVNEQSW